MTKLGRRHRPFFRLCAVDGRAARDGKVIEYLGHYDPMIKETDARAQLNKERIDYWLGVGAQPSQKVAVLIKKYGTNGTHLEQQQQALERLASSKPTAPPPVAIPRKEEESAAAAEEDAGAEAAAATEQSDAGAAEASGGESAASDETTGDESQGDGEGEAKSE